MEYRQVSQWGLKSTGLSIVYGAKSVLFRLFRQRKIVGSILEVSGFIIK